MTAGNILENMKKNDKFIGDVLAPFEQALGMKFNKFNKPEDPKYVEPKKKKNLKLDLKKAQRKQKKLQSNPDKAKEVGWKNAIDKAQGLKVRDDPKMIKKVMKRKQDEKKRHKKKWAERTAKQEESKQFREKKKRDNKQKAKENKGKKGKKVKGKQGKGKKK